MEEAWACPWRGTSSAAWPKRYAAPLVGAARHGVRSLISDDAANGLKQLISLSPPLTMGAGNLWKEMIVNHQLIFVIKPFESAGALSESHFLVESNMGVGELGNRPLFLVSHL